MASLKKPIGISILLFGGLVAGFIFLLRGCLAKYDERFAKPPVLVFEKNGKKTVFSVVEFQKTTSYSRKGGMVSKSVNTSFYIQVNDGVTAELMNNRKIKKHRQVKYHPVEVMGAAGDYAWVFIGEPMAFDGFTLETIADKEILEKKNPALTNLLPDERRYYEFSNQDRSIYVTAKDGSKWIINGTTLAATPANGKTATTSAAKLVKDLEMAIQKNNAANDSLYQQKNYRVSKDYSAGKISQAEYQRITKIFYAERDSLQKIRDSLYELRSQAESKKRDLEEMERAIENLERDNPSYSEIKDYQDTANGKWYGLYSEEEFEKLGPRIYNHKVYDETARRTLIVCNYTRGKSGELVIDKESGQQISTSGFLDGGFLLNRKTATAITISGKYLVVHKNQVGNESTIIITAMDKSGKTGWSYNTGLSQWSDWKTADSHMYIVGTNNKNLSSSEANLLICLNVTDGKALVYDYFRNKMVK